jgi:predicted nucleic acid-binding protein
VAYYIDTSALVKLVIEEAETWALMRWLGADDRTAVSCDLIRTELIRVTRRAAPDQMIQAREVLDGLTLTEVTTAVFEAAGRLDPTMLRSLDAIHLAAALDLGDDLDGIVTYDARLADAARAQGIPVIAPTDTTSA